MQNNYLAVNIGTTFGSPFGQTVGVGNLMSAILSNAVVLGGITLFLLFLFGGISIIQGAGNNDPKAVSGGKQAVTAAIVGFLIIFSAYWILSIIYYLTGFSLNSFFSLN